MKKLNFGDRVGIVSTARKINLKELDMAVNIFNQWGLKVELGVNLLNEDNQFSGTIQQRTSDLQAMLDNDKIKAVICARGGYGTVQIIDNIDFTLFINNPKWIVGYSDVTVLHSHLNNLDIPTLHASMPINFKSNTKESLETLRKTLFGEKNYIKIDTNNYNVLGIAEGEIVGGNLSILYSLMGSNSDLDTDGKILFIEDLDEYLYHIDRMMISLKRSGKLENIKGLIVGGMTNMHDNKVRYGRNAEQIIRDYIIPYNIPTCFGFPAGHIKDNRCIKFGVESVLNVNKSDVFLSQK